MYVCMCDVPTCVYGGVVCMWVYVCGYVYTCDCGCVCKSICNLKHNNECMTPCQGKLQACYSCFKFCHLHRSTANRSRGNSHYRVSQYRVHHISLYVYMYVYVCMCLTCMCIHIYLLLIFTAGTSL